MAINNRIGIDWRNGLIADFLQESIDFEQRVVADGGTFEALSCVITYLISSPQGYRARQLYDAYDARCEAASGDTEARVCTINELNDLL